MSCSVTLRFSLKLSRASPTCRIDTFIPRGSILSPDPDLPLIRTLYLARNRDIDPPSPRLLGVHSAIAHILHLSGAGEYIDRLLDDAEDNGVRADGSTELGRLISLGLRRWDGGILGHNMGALDRSVYFSRPKKWQPCIFLLIRTNVLCDSSVD